MNQAASIDTEAAAPVADNRSRVAKPAHVPDHLVRDIDMYALDGIEAGYHEAWVGLHAQNMPKLVWTPLTGGHWIAMDGPMVREIYEDPARFSSEVIFLPKEAGLIVADRYDAVLVRDAMHRPLAPARRKAELLRFARRAARRLSAQIDPSLGDDY